MYLSKTDNQEQINDAAHYAIDKLLDTAKYVTRKDLIKLSNKIVEISDEYVILPNLSHKQ